MRKGEGEWQCETKATIKEKLCEQAELKFMTSGYSRSLLQSTQPQGLVGGGEWKPIDCLHTECYITVSSNITFDGKSLIYLV